MRSAPSGPGWQYALAAPRNRIGAGHVAHRQFLRHIDEIVFRKCQPRDLLGPPPHPIEIGDAIWSRVSPA